jgi:hypothetical protein
MMVRTVDGQLWICGSQYGHIQNWVPRPMDAALVERAQIVMVATSYLESTVALSAAGDVWTWDAAGSLGHDTIQNIDIPTKIRREAFPGSSVVMVSCGRGNAVAVTENKAMFAWGDNDDGELGLCNTGFVLTPTRVRAGVAFDSSVCMAVAAHRYTLALTEGDVMWECGKFHGWRANSLMQPMDAHRYFDGAKIVIVSGEKWHAAAVTEDGAIYTWGKACTRTLGHADMLDKQMSTLISPRHLLDARIGCCHRLLPEHALAFSMDTHTRLGSPATEAHAGGSTRSKRVQDKVARVDTSEGCVFVGIPPETVKKIVEACRWQPEGSGEGMLRLMGRGGCKLGCLRGAPGEWRRGCATRGGYHKEFYLGLLGEGGEEIIHF